MAIEITQVIRRMEQGFTQPYICGCSDGAKYVVKGSNTTGNQLAIELICAFLSKNFGLPLPDFALIRVPQEIIDSGAFPGLDIEWCFGSKLIDSLTEMLFTQIKKIDKQVMLDLYIFDYWISNPDRSLTKHGGNPNAFYDISKSSLIIFDHNLAFDEQFSVGTHKELHLASTVWNCEQTRIDDKPMYSERFAIIMDNWQHIIEQVPSEWFENENAKSSFMANIKVRLLSYTNNQFWEGIK
ncbi:hypothetical protein K8B83_14870 [Shewanella inventionis]|uniref:HipA family kinase n=1 Tax=Shewanella inventionis TaxID=1738770 RepID=UPI001CBDF9D2|nr:HipA family kinase [Shewanella inventionis]UAL42157.1 hypothetical protein K8B83_14870 [Shewanella inventionis]